MDENELYDDLARRLCAAAISYQMGNRSVDYTMKTYVSKDSIGEYWISLAKKVSQDLATSRATTLGR